MSEPIERIRHTMTEATPRPKEGGPHHEPGPHIHDRIGTDIKRHNAEVHPGHREHLVDIGRGQDYQGRGSRKD